jgi:hypothetical protein
MRGCGSLALAILVVLAGQAPGMTAGQRSGLPSGPPSRAALASYALAVPDTSIVLPPRLAEVSGVTALSGTEVALIQDEDGVVFVYDLARRRIVREIPFGLPGDYEDVAVADSRLFVLRSDGVLFEIQGLSGRPRVRAHVLRLPASDSEGLCLDARRRRLLIAPKSMLARGEDLKDTRRIFAYGLGAAALEPRPAMIFSVDAVRAFAERQARQVRGKRAGPGGNAGASLRFMPSAIAIHPTTFEIFVVSAVDRVLATFDENGRVTGFASLDAGLFRQPEGLTFLANGDLVITSEASGARPLLHLFKPRSQPAR